MWFVPWVAVQSAREALDNCCDVTICLLYLPHTVLTVVHYPYHPFSHALNSMLNPTEIHSGKWKSSIDREQQRWMSRHTSKEEHVRCISFSLLWLTQQLLTATSLLLVHAEHEDNKSLVHQQFSTSKYTFMPSATFGTTSTNPISHPKNCHTTTIVCNN